MFSRDVSVGLKARGDRLRSKKAKIKNIGKKMFTIWQNKNNNKRKEHKTAAVYTHANMKNVLEQN